MGAGGLGTRRADAVLVRSRSARQALGAPVLKVATRRRLRALIDAAAWAIGLFAATLLRLDFAPSRMSDFTVFALLPVAIAAQWSIGYASRLYRDGQVYGSFEEISTLARAVFP